MIWISLGVIATLLAGVCAYLMSRQTLAVNLECVVCDEVFNSSKKKSRRISCCKKNIHVECFQAYKLSKELYNVRADVCPYSSCRRQNCTLITEESNAKCTLL